MTSDERNISKSVRQSFTDEVGRPHEIADDLERRIAEASVAAEPGDVVLGGYRAPELGRGVETAAERRSKEKDGDTALVIMADHIARLREQLEELYALRDSLIEELDRIRDIQDKLAEWYRAFDAGEEPELNPDGSLRDAELEALVAAHERRSGHSVDRSDPAALMAIIAAEQAVQADAFSAARDRLADVNEQIDAVEAELDAYQADRQPGAQSNHYGQQDRDTAFRAGETQVAERDGEAPEKSDLSSTAFQPSV